MRKSFCVFLACFIVSANADENPFFNGYDNQIVFMTDGRDNIGGEVNTPNRIAKLEKIINASREAGKIIVATGDVHHFEREDKIYREIIAERLSHIILLN